MRSAWVVVFVAACYQPQNNSYPDAGIIIHDSWSVEPDSPWRSDAAWYPDAPQHDAHPDAPPDAPPPPPVCGDGVRAPGEICFATPVTVSAGELVYSARLRDVDGDGKLDLIYLTRTNVVTRKGNGNGGFAAPIVGPATDSWWLDVGDINGDGIADIAATGRQQLTVWFGTGGGAFGAPSTLALYDAPVGIAVTEIDGYPGKEIVVATPDYLYTVTWFVNALDTLSQNGISSISIACADLDADGRSDCVDTTYDYGYQYNGGVDGLDVYTSIGGDGDVAGVALANVDGDPKTDAIVALPVFDKIAVYSKVQNSPDYATTHMYASELWAVTTGTPRFVAAADLDGDGVAEVVAGMPDTMRLQLFHPDGTAAAPIQLTEPITSQFFDGDANGDGVSDLVVTLQDKIFVLPSAAP
jgi:VCBS repeat protein